ncbi:MAG: hypothetical protein VYD19_11570 [Myxococcota bacterium]|nr:hypothetical protein [Myxococcota bacterium]
MDLSGVLSPCQLLEPLQEWGDRLLRSVFFMGIAGEGVLGPGVSTGGYDLVWDFYHAQLSVSHYGGTGLTTSAGAGVAVSAYAGWVSGFRHSVADWDGLHVSVSTELSLPFIKDYIHLKPEAFFSAEDLNGDGRVQHDELLLPPEGIYGFSIGVGVGLELFPDPIPISVTLTEGDWRPYASAIGVIYRDLKRRRLFPLVGEPLAVQLVDEHNGASCPGDWPVSEGDRDCIIQFGEPGWSRTKTGLHVAASLCALSGGCVTPLAWPQSALAIAIGAWRDRKGGPLDALCEAP